MSPEALLLGVWSWVCSMGNMGACWKHGVSALLRTTKQLSSFTASPGLLCHIEVRGCGSEIPSYPRELGFTPGDMRFTSGSWDSPLRCWVSSLGSWG